MLNSWINTELIDIQTSMLSLFVARLFLVHLRHSLLNDGVSSCFADDEVSPLHNHNTSEECRVACELYYFSAFICLKEGSGKER